MNILSTMKLLRSLHHKQDVMESVLVGPLYLQQIIRHVLTFLLTYVNFVTTFYMQIIIVGTKEGLITCGLVQPLATVRFCAVFQLALQFAFAMQT